MSNSQSTRRGNTRALLRKALPFFLRYKGLFFTGLVFMVLFGASDGVVPFLIKEVLDGIFSKQDKTLLTVLPVALVLFGLVRATADFFQQYLISKVGHSVTRDLRSSLNEKLLSLSGDFYAYRSPGDLVSRLTGDVLLVRSMLTDAASSVIRDSIRLVALLAASIYLDWMLALMAFTVLPVALLPVYRFGKKMRRLSREGQDQTGKLSSVMEQGIDGAKIVKIFGRERHEQERFDVVNHSVTKTFLRSERVKALTGPVNEMFASLGIAAVIFYGGFSVLNGLRTQGEFIAFLVSIFLMYDPFKKLSKVNNAVQQGLASFERLNEILETEPSVKTPVNPKPFPTDYTIRYESVGFAYAGSDQKALSEVTFELKQGEVVALVGRSGSGKSTCVDLIPRLVDPTEGRVTLGGVDIRELELSSLRGLISLVSQHTFLFPDSVINNIRYGKLDASDREVFDVARRAGAHEFIEKLPKGYFTDLGEGGMTLSGGERQRIAIARAMLKDSPILILDEATASLDSHSEQVVQEALQELQKGKTTIVIAHRLSTVRQADRILVMSDGKVIESGTYQELLARNGEFSNLHTIQFGAGNG